MPPFFFNESASEFCILKRSTFEICSNQVGIAKLSHSKICVPKVSSSEISVIQSCSCKISVRKICVFHFCASQIRMLEIWSCRHKPSQQRNRLKETGEVVIRAIFEYAHHNCSPKYKTKISKNEISGVVNPPKSNRDSHDQGRKCYCDKQKCCSHTSDSIGIPKIRTPKDSRCKVSPFQFCTLQICVREVGRSEVAQTQVTVFKIYARKITLLKFNSDQVAFRKLAISQNYTIQLGFGFHSVVLPDFLTNCSQTSHRRANVSCSTAVFLVKRFCFSRNISELQVIELTNFFGTVLDERTKKVLCKVKVVLRVLLYQSFQGQGSSLSQNQLVISQHARCFLIAFIVEASFRQVGLPCTGTSSNNSKQQGEQPKKDQSCVSKDCHSISIFAAPIFVVQQPCRDLRSPNRYARPKGGRANDQCNDRKQKQCDYEVAKQTIGLLGPEEVPQEFHLSIPDANICNLSAIPGALTTGTNQAMIPLSWWFASERVTQRRAGIGLPSYSKGARYAPRHVYASGVLLLWLGGRERSRAPFSFGTVRPILLVWPPEIGLSCGWIHSDQRRFAMVVLADDTTRACRDLRNSLENIDLAVAQFGALLHAMSALGNNLPPHQCEAVQSIVTLQSLLFTHHKEIFTHTQSAWHSTRTLLPTQGAA
ncbi:hypothetical protein PSE_3028 [Pseudovibrio sp. FO-BEG1]|nr:hypothetical protein PSE_3028 [Pseudovibrio sp. FO-BEG1]